MAKWASAQVGAPALSLDSDANEDAWTPSAGVSDSVKGMLGLGSQPRQEDRVLPVFLEEVFGKWSHVQWQAAANSYRA